MAPQPRIKLDKKEAKKGDLVEVKGSLRRRFFAPAGGGRVSRCEVEVSSARLIRRADG